MAALTASANGLLGIRDIGNEGAALATVGSGA